MNFEFLTPNLILVWKIVSLVVSALFLGFIVFALIRSSYLERAILMDFYEFLSVNPYGAKKLYKQWQKIKQKLETGSESEYKSAVIEADSALEDVLKGRKFDGETVTERLEKIPQGTISNLSELLEVRRTRNNVVHEPDFSLGLEEARRVLDVYEKSLSDLNAI